MYHPSVKLNRLGLILTFLSLGFCGLAAAANASTNTGEQDKTAWFTSLKAAAKRQAASCAAVSALKKEDAEIALTTQKGTFLINPLSKENAKSLAIKRSLQDTKALIETTGLPWPDNLDYRISSEKTGFTLSVPTKSNKSYADYCDIVTEILKDLASRSTDIPAAARPAFGLINAKLLQDQIRLAEQIVSRTQFPLLRKGGTLVLSVPANIEAAIGPQGTAAELTKLPDGQKKLTLRQSAGGATGVQEVLLFAEGNRLQPAARQKILIVPKAGLGAGQNRLTNAAAAKDAEDPQTLAIGQSLEGNLAPGQIQRYSLSVGKEESVQIHTQGGTDVLARLYTKDGTLIRADDDSGKNYNAALKQTGLPAGTYTLEISHCCGGSGGYRVERDAEERRAKEDLRP